MNSNYSMMKLMAKERMNTRLAEAEAYRAGKKTDAAKAFVPLRRQKHFVFLSTLKTRLMAQAGHLLTFMLAKVKLEGL